MWLGRLVRGGGQLLRRERLVLSPRPVRGTLQWHEVVSAVQPKSDGRWRAERRVVCDGKRVHCGGGTNGLQILVEHWNGTKWSIQSAPHPAGALFSQLNGVSCPLAGACTAVGFYQNAGGGRLTLVERWNGSGWSLRPSPNHIPASSSLLNAVSGPSFGECFGAGAWSNGTWTALA